MQHIVGQPRALDLLQAQLSTGRTHHAFIFHGPSGVGKFTTAVAFAQVLLCHDRQTTLTGAVEACGSCESCRFFTTRPQAAAEDEPEAMALAHPDLHVVTKELARYSDDRSTRERKLTQIPVEVLRTALIEPVYRAPRLSGGKVFILDEAELLNPTGQNLLLKTLEEPPSSGGGTTIILVTSSEDRLLPTIRSRCQRVAFVPLPEEAVARWVDAQENKPVMTERDRAWLISFANGSLGRAKLALEFDLAQWAQAVLPVLDGAAAGRPTPGEFGAQLAGMIDGFAKEWVDRHDNASKEAANNLAAGLMGSLIATHARERVAQLAEQADPADPVAAEAALEPWLRAIDAVSEAGRLLSTNVNLSLVCDWLAVRLARVLSGERSAFGVAGSAF